MAQNTENANFRRKQSLNHPTPGDTTQPMEQSSTTDLDNGSPTWANQDEDEPPDYREQTLIMKWLNSPILQLI